LLKVTYGRTNPIKDFETSNINIKKIKVNIFLLLAKMGMD